MGVWKCWSRRLRGETFLKHFQTKINALRRYKLWGVRRHRWMDRSEVSDTEQLYRKTRSIPFEHSTWGTFMLQSVIKMTHEARVFWLTGRSQDEREVRGDAMMSRTSKRFQNLRNQNLCSEQRHSESINYLARLFQEPLGIGLDHKN